MPTEPEHPISIPPRQSRRRRRAAVAAALLGVSLCFAALNIQAQEAEPPPPPPPPPPPAATPSVERQEPVPPPDLPSGLFPEGGPARQPRGTASGNAASSRRGNASSSRSGRSSAAARRDRFAEPSLFQAAQDPLRLRITYRRARTEVLRDPRFAELQREANAARSDEEKRAILRIYYEELFARIRRHDQGVPGMNAHIDLLATAARQRYDPQRKTGAESVLANTQSNSTSTSRRSQR